MGLRHLIALAILTGMAFPAWSQVLNITAVDSFGSLLEGADVSISYQKANRFAIDDGLLEGRTDANGRFSANISNVVPDAYHNNAISLRISHKYGGGEQKNLQAGVGPMELGFAFPFKVEKMRATALSIESLPVGNVTVFLTPAALKKTTDSEGVAEFQVPQGEAYSGFATYLDKRVAFDSSQAKIENGIHYVVLDIPVRKLPESAIANKSITLNLRIFGLDAKPLPGQQVIFSFLGGATTGVTDGAGLVSFGTDEPGSLNITVRKYEYNYTRQYNISATSNESFTLGRLMKLNSFRYDKEPEENCYLVKADVTDPRLALPRQGRLIRLYPSFNSTQQIGMDGNGFFSARVCVTSGLNVMMNITNKYENVTTGVLHLPYEPPKPPLNESIGPKEPDVQEIGISIIAFLLVGGFSAIIILRRKQVQRALNYVLTYFRQVVMRIIGSDKRKKPTPKPSAAQQQAKPKDEITQKIEAVKEEIGKKD